ncbi:hypothetical protein ABMA28_008910 [Loxostege sticticalis]|uniref:t-SNARE coiled-coil homology domain-containing protein n=1 Tax=Loxostege sticticalis TaxID=481309 RepID=A0ABD0SF38_LOXSC
MSLKAYEDACTRAELFGQPKPDKAEFLERNKHLDVVEFEEVEIRTAENTAMLGEQMTEASGGLQELNTILTSTQTKINRLKGVCGSLTNFFRVKLSARDNLSYSSEPSYVGQTNYDKDYIPPSTDNASINQGLGPGDNEMTARQHGHNDGVTSHRVGDINSALDDLKEMEKNENSALINKGAVKDIGKQVTSQVSRLDQMINQADRAQSSLQHQNKQLRTFLR